MSLSIKISRRFLIIELFRDVLDMFKLSKVPLIILLLLLWADSSRWRFTSISFFGYDILEKLHWSVFWLSILISTRSVFSVWILKQKGHSNQWSNLLGDPSHSIIEWVLKYSIGRFLKKLAHSEKIREINVKLIISNKYFSVFSLILIQSDWKYNKMYF